MKVSSLYIKMAKDSGGCIQCGCVKCGSPIFNIFIRSPERVEIACAKCETPLAGFNEVLNAE